MSAPVWSYESTDVLVGRYRTWGARVIRQHGGLWHSILRVEADDGSGETNAHHGMFDNAEQARATLEEVMVECDVIYRADSGLVTSKQLRFQEWGMKIKGLSV